MFCVPKPNLKKLKEVTRKLERVITKTANRTVHNPKCNYVASSLKAAVKRRNVNLLLTDVEKELSSFLSKHKF